MPFCLLNILWALQDRPFIDSFTIGPNWQNTQKVVKCQCREPQTVVFHVLCSCIIDIAAHAYVVDTIRKLLPNTSVNFINYWKRCIFSLVFVVVDLID